MPTVPAAGVESQAGDDPVAAHAAAEIRLGLGLGNRLVGLARPRPVRIGEGDRRGEEPLRLLAEPASRSVATAARQKPQAGP